MNLVVGATGLLDGFISHRLRELGRPVRALARRTADPNKLEALKKAGAELAFGDLKDPSSLVAACAGVSSLITTASSTFSRQPADSIETVDRQGHLALIEAAKGAGVGRFVYTSIPVDRRYDSPLGRAKTEVEQRLIGSGMEYTILAANFFMEVWLTPIVGFDYSNCRARIYGDGSKPLTWVSYKDVGELAVRAAGSAETCNKLLEIGGPEHLSPLEVVRIFEDVSGAPFEVEMVAEQALLEQKRNAPDPLSETFAALMLEYAAGCRSDNAETQRLMPMRLTTVGEYALSVAAAGRAAAGGPNAR
jgi:NADH dehydrogenase